ncbi:MAG TPA: rhodanese-like domain-containing protein [Tepidisphaeraceae bacterium]|nr:rhodanese-like domain-containing protein [Tepidisphaeraceae bacterium]
MPNPLATLIWLLAMITMLAFARRLVWLMPAVIGVSSLGFHITARDGLLHDSNRTRWVIENHLLAIPSMSLDEAQSKRAQFIDARPSTDFNAGHIANAISIQIFESDFERAQRLQHFDRSQLLVVYCKPKACALDATIARKLREDGFKNVYKLEGGYETIDDRNRNSSEDKIEDRSELESTTKTNQQ